MQVDDFILGDTLGEGTFGKVKIAIHSQTGQKVAVKILNKIKIKQNRDEERISREINILKKMMHPNIAQLYAVIETTHNLYLIMEYAESGELFHHIVLNQKLSEIESCKLFQQLIYGVEYLHKNYIVHRDLKPENLLLHKSKLKIVDFGLSNIYNMKKHSCSSINLDLKNRNNVKLLNTACGSPSYAAPEMIEGLYYDGITVDVWSCGIILYAMVCGCLPFDDKNNDILFKKIIKGKFALPKYLSPKLQDLLIKILKKDPKKRINLNDIKCHPWFNSLFNNRIPGLLINNNILIKYINSTSSNSSSSSSNNNNNKNKFIHLIPIDYNVISELEELNFDKNEVIDGIINNRHNRSTTCYYLLVKKKINDKKETVSDFGSKLFLNYLDNFYKEINLNNNSLTTNENINNSFNNKDKVRASKCYNFQTSVLKSFSNNIVNNTFNEQNSQIAITDFNNSILLQNNFNNLKQNSLLDYNKHEKKDSIEILNTNNIYTDMLAFDNKIENTFNKNILINDNNNTLNTYIYNGYMLNSNLSNKSNIKSKDIYNTKCVKDNSKNNKNNLLVNANKKKFNKSISLDINKEINDINASNNKRLTNSSINNYIINNNTVVDNNYNVKESSIIEKLSKNSCNNAKSSYVNTYSKIINKIKPNIFGNIKSLKNNKNIFDTNNNVNKNINNYSKNLNIFQINEYTKTINPYNNSIIKSTENKHKEVLSNNFTTTSYNKPISKKLNSNNKINNGNIYNITALNKYNRNNTPNNIISSNINLTTSNNNKSLYEKCKDKENIFVEISEYNQRSDIIKHINNNINDNYYKPNNSIKIKSNYSNIIKNVNKRLNICSNFALDKEKLNSINNSNKISKQTTDKIVNNVLYVKANIKNNNKISVVNKYTNKSNNNFNKKNKSILNTSTVNINEASVQCKSLDKKTNKTNLRNTTLNNINNTNFSNNYTNNYHMYFKNKNILNNNLSTSSNCNIKHTKSQPATKKEKMQFNKILKIKGFKNRLLNINYYNIVNNNKFKQPNQARCSSLRTKTNNMSINNIYSNKITSNRNNINDNNNFNVKNNNSNIAYKKKNRASSTIMNINDNSSIKYYKEMFIRNKNDSIDKENSKYLYKH